MNVQVDGEKEPKSVDQDELTRWEPLSDDGKAILLTANEEMSQAQIDAKEREIQNLRDNIFEAVGVK